MLVAPDVREKLMHVRLVTISQAARIPETDNKILVLGSSSGDFALARYNEDGMLDTSFSSG